MQAEVQKQFHAWQVQAESHALDDRPDVVLPHRQAHRAPIRRDHPQAPPAWDRQVLLHQAHQVLIDLAEHQRTDLVTRLVEGLRGDLTDRVGAIAQVPEELIEFRLDGGMNAGEQKTDDGGQRQGAAAGEVFGIKTSDFKELS